MSDNNSILDTENAIIKRLKMDLSATNAERIVALYITGMSSKKVWSHIKNKTFSGARAIHHITNPSTAEARSAWSRGKDVCTRAGLPIRRLDWTDQTDKDLYELKHDNIQINDEEDHYIPDKSDSFSLDDHEDGIAHATEPQDENMESNRPLTSFTALGKNEMSAKEKLVHVVRILAAEKRSELERLKREYKGLERPDFIWHYLLQSFSTMGRASGWHGLIENKRNYDRVTYDVLAALTSEDRSRQVRRVCRDAKIRMPDMKADYILGCFDYVRKLGGLEATKAKLLSQRGREAKIRFLQTFPGIGPKYARNIMMDVYHEDFRDSIALDVRIKAISDALGLSFANYASHESFYLNVAREAGINGWELDRLLFNFRSEVESKLDRLGIISTQPKFEDKKIKTDKISAKSGQQKKTEGCFIATACYDSPFVDEVIVLRKFRDESLRTIWFGRIFIRLYNFLSPIFANYLMGKTNIKKFLRIFILDKIVFLIRKRFYGVHNTKHNFLFRGEHGCDR